jgi:uncharacterized membrane protein
MVFCSNCGTQVPGAFCPNCGAPAGAPSPSAGPTPGTGAPYGTGVPPANASSSASGLTENVASALCYALGLITGIIFLVLAPYNQNKNIRFHAFQSIFLHLAFIAFFIVLNLLSFAIHLGFITFLLSPLIAIAGFALWLYLLFSAYQGKKVVLPIIGPLAQQQA